MPVDINKWKETSLDAYLEVSLVKELGEESREGAELSVAGSASFSGVQVVPWTPMATLGSMVGSWGQWFRRQHAKGWTRHRSHWYSQLPMALHLCPPLSLLLGERGGNFRLDC